MSGPVTIFSTEDWPIQVTALDGSGNPFDLTSYDLRAQFRQSPVGTVIDDCSISNGKISRTGQSNVVLVTSLASGRSWVMANDLPVVMDLMGYLTVGNVEYSVMIAHVICVVTAGVTHD